MSETAEIDLGQIVLVDGPFGPQDIRQLEEAIQSDRDNLKVLRDAVEELQSKQENLSPASMVRLGVCQYILGRFDTAMETLRQGDGGALAHFYLARSLAAQQQFDEAVASYTAAEKAGYNHDECALGRANVLLSAEKAEESLAVLDELSGAVEQTAAYLAQRGATVASIGNNPLEVVALYERAVEADEMNPAALFGLALENDRFGNDDVALDLYKKAARQLPTHVGSLLNLGLMYEDRDEIDRAAQCYRRVLEVYPSHDRALLYLKDTEASSEQYYDEDAQRKKDRLAQVLNVPVTDFELSVRSRNCLQKVGIMTLGDLCRCTEAELLASKNFGETSLIEIREMLSSKGLRLGQLAAERPTPEPFDTDTMSEDEQAMLAKPIAELSLSVRARKCMIRMGINTIGDLLRRTGDDLLECKNFGVTSLNEVREKLKTVSLRLRGE